MDEITKVPACADLERFTRLIGEQKGLSVKELTAGTILRLEAKSGAVLTLIITDPTKAEARLQIEGSRDIDGEYMGTVSGSTFGGSFIKIGWISDGMCLEFYVPSTKSVIKSWIKSVYIVEITPISKSVN